MASLKMRAEKHLIKETMLDPETGEEIPVYKHEIRPKKLGELMGIGSRKASQILAQFKDDPEYEKVILHRGCCIYKLIQ